MKIRTSFTILLISAIILTVLPAIFIGIIPVRRFMSSQMYEEIPVILSAAKSGIQSEIGRGWEASLSLTRNPVLIHWFLTGEESKSEEDIVRNMMTELATREGFASAFAANVYTRHYWSDGEMIDVLSEDDSADAWFFSMITSSKELILNLDYNSVLKTTNLWFDALVRSEGQNIGIAGIGISIDKVINEFKSSAPSTNSVLYLVDSSGKILVSSLDEVTNQPLADFVSSDAIPVKQYEGIRTWRDTNGKKMLTAEQEIANTDYRIVITAPESDFVPAFFSTWGQSLLYAFILAIVISIAGSLIIRRRLSKLHNLSSAFEEMVTGNLDIRLAESKDEIGTVARDFNAFLGSLGKSMKTIAESVENGTDINRNLVLASNESVSAVTQINASLDSNREHMRSLDESVETSSDAIVRITDAFTRLDNAIGKQRSMVKESSLSVSDMKKAISEMTTESQKRQKSFHTLEEITRTSSQSLEETEQAFVSQIESRMQDISEMNEMISQVAEQTNLLAMNAAIEAAHAGESGKGFTVVAEEIQRLANETAENAGNIASVINQMQEGITQTGQNIRSSISAFKSIETESSTVTNSFNEMIDSLGSISGTGDQTLSAMTELETYTDKIGEASVDMTEKIRVLSGEAGNMRQQSTELTSGTDEVSIGSADILQSMEKLRTLNEEFSRIFKSIVANLAQFHLT